MSFVVQLCNRERSWRRVGRSADGGLRGTALQWPEQRIRTGTGGSTVQRRRIKMQRSAAGQFSAHSRGTGEIRGPLGCCCNTKPKR
jgi:hypothetical protein